MGVANSQLKNSSERKHENCPLLNSRLISLFQFNPSPLASLPKLREFHSSFKSICDGFSIDLTEFEQIFGSNETSFAIWDTDNNGMIDALELFSGLVIYAEAKFEEKIRCNTHSFPLKAIISFQ